MLKEINMIGKVRENIAKVRSGIKEIKAIYDQKKEEQKIEQAKIRGDEEFSMNIDYVVTAKGECFLLEINPRGGEDQIFRSKAGTLVGLLDKLHQHKVLGDIMPPYTANKEEFSEFAKQNNGRVVYKRRAGYGGEWVSVIERPTKWEPDFIERFEEPASEERDGKHFAYVVRDSLKFNGLTKKYRREKVFRKTSKTSIEDATSPNQAFKLNIVSGTAEEREASGKEIDLVSALTSETMKRIGEKTMWVPTKYFNEPVVGIYGGPERAIFQNDKINPDVLKIIEDNGINTDLMGFPVSGEVRDIPFVARNLDVLVVEPSYRTYWGELKSYTYMRKNEIGRIEFTDRDGKPLSIAPLVVPDNVFLGDEDPEKVAAGIIRKYFENRWLA